MSNNVQVYTHLQPTQKIEKGKKNNETVYTTSMKTFHVDDMNVRVNVGKVFSCDIDHKI